MFQFNQTLGCLRKTPTETAECLKLVLVKSLDWYPVDDCRRAMLKQMYFLAERQEIKGRQSSLVKSRGRPNETTDKMADKFKPELVQCSNKITGYLTDSITHTHILQQVSNTHLCIFLV